ncbi:uncharacterized protein LOC135439781 [Drosophila montana]|uniref:uncharacterized protein LOC135439781 n=1 Tax=Drosophila montana TaxID=40370 RepID=UPI00313C5EC0
MVNFNNSTKMMVNRCMELLNAKIAHAQTRHIAKRVPLDRISPRVLDAKALFRERQKAEKYEACKRLSMWEQNKDQQSDWVENERLDHSHYKHSQLRERTYDCTWTKFPEEPKPKQRRMFKSEGHIPICRRKTGTRPETAKPWDDEASDFIKQWDNNNAMINRNRFGKTTHFSQPHVGGGSLNGKHPKRKLFYY